jgi:hypothetical protein
MSLKIIELEVDEALTGETRVEEIALVLNPAIETEFLYFKKEDFVKPKEGESEDDFIGRCMGVLYGEGKPQDQSYAICKSMWDEGFNELEDACWEGYEPIGTKIKDGREVPNCVPESEKFQSYSDYPKGVKEVAQRVLKWTEENGWGSCGTDVGKQRANQLAKGEPISFETIKRMYSYLSRHKVDLESSKSYDDGCGKLMYDAWGGEPALSWSERKIKQIEEELNADDPCGCECYDCGDDKGLYFGQTLIDGMPVFDDEEAANLYAEEIGCKGSHEHTIDGKTYYMPCEIHPNEAIDDMINDKGEELEELLKQGWIIAGVKNVNTDEILKSTRDKFSKLTREDFYTIMTKPGEQSFLDSADGRRKTRFVYMVGFGADIIPTSRGFCKRMLGGRQFVFRFEDIMMLNAEIAGEANNMKIIPRPKGTEVDIFTYKGGANCRHLWWEITLMPPLPDGDPVKSTNNKRKMIEDASYKGPAASQAGQVNPPVEYGSRSAKSVGLSKDIIPSGFLQGLPVFEMKEDAKNYSTEFGCGGLIEEVEYMGKKMFQSCSYKKQKNDMQFSVDTEKRMIYSPAMKPGILIPRLDDITGERYFVTFKPETIEIMAQRYLIEKRIDKTNYEHTDKKFDGVYLVESWIVNGGQDKAYDLGYSKEQIPKGTWMVGFRVDNEEVWSMIKKGKVKGISIEGNFQYVLPKNKFAHYKSDEYLLEKIINILNKLN